MLLADASPPAVISTVPVRLCCGTDSQKTVEVWYRRKAEVRYDFVGKKFSSGNHAQEGWMPKERPPAEARTAAQLALKFRHRREAVVYEVAEEEIGADRPELGPQLAWRFAGEGWQVTLSLAPVAAGWHGTVAIDGEPQFDVTVYRGDGVRDTRVGQYGEAYLGFLAPGPLSLTCVLPDGRAVQTAWLTLPGAHTRSP